jgi:hypothetical protein
MQNILKLIIAVAMRPGRRLITNAIIAFLDHRQKKALRMTDEEWDLPWREWRRVASQRFREGNRKQGQKNIDTGEPN